MGILEARGIEGVLLDVPSHIPVLRPFSLYAFYVVSFQQQTQFRCHQFSHDRFLNAQLQMVHLWRLGYRRIGYVMNDTKSHTRLYRDDAGFLLAQYHLVPEASRIPPLHLDTQAEHLRNYLWKGKTPPDRYRADESAWLQQHAWTPPDPPIPEHEHEHHQAAMDILRVWIEQFQPEVIVCEDQRMRDWLEDLGHRVPHDIALSHAHLKEDVPDWSGIELAESALAAAAANHMVDTISIGRPTQPETPIHHFFSGKWIEGSTTRRIRTPILPYTDQADRYIRRVLAEPITPYPETR
jgi:DNA-binding LacI/PurR family transcriptional regulator